MIKFCNLFSGSSGNSTYIETASTKILIDVGVSCQRISKALEKIGAELSTVDAIIISHEHIDHIKGLEVISKKYSIPVFATLKTWGAMSFLNIDDGIKNFFVPDVDFSIGDITVSPFLISHDAIEPCAFNILSDSKKITVATDLGFISKDVISKMFKSDVVLLESNYDDSTLMYGPYPYSLKKRIQSKFGHLSNFDTSRAIKELYENGTSYFVLGHLSKENNFPELAYQTVLNEINSSSCNNPFSLSVAKRDDVDDVIII